MTKLFKNTILENIPNIKHFIIMHKHFLIIYSKFASKFPNMMLQHLLWNLKLRNYLDFLFRPFGFHSFFFFLLINLHLNFSFSPLTKLCFLTETQDTQALLVVGAQLHWYQAGTVWASACSCWAQQSSAPAQVQFVLTAVSVISCFSDSKFGPLSFPILTSCLSASPEVSTQAAS